MRYHNITKDDMLNGDGLRVVLWVAGCSHCCKDCQNPITWDPNGGLEFDEAAKQEIFAELEKDFGVKITVMQAVHCVLRNKRSLRRFCRGSEDHLPALSLLSP